MISKWLNDLITDDWFRTRLVQITHIKTNKDYYLTGIAINSTNTQDNQQMVIYTDIENRKRFVREINEFSEKFKLKEQKQND